MKFVLAASTLRCLGLAAAGWIGLHAGGWGACPHGEDQCLPGLVWRGAFPGDTVCVSGAQRDRTALENDAAGANHLPGSTTCRPGLVWRDAEPDDRVCVSGAARAQAAADNAAAGARRDPSCKIARSRDGLSILNVNFNGSGGSLPGADVVPYQQRARRLAIWARRHGVVPDVIALQEIHGWVYAPPTRSCGNGWANGVGDYDQLDVILKALEDMTRVRYRVAYMTGRVTHWGPPPPFSCDVFHAQAMLYNPSRLVNVTQREVGSRPHDDEAGLAGVAHLRRSLPLCNRGTGLMPLASLIDGPLQTDKCGRPTPSGPAHVTFSVKGYLAASHVRFEFRHAPGKFVDVFNVHPGNGVIEPDISNIRALLDAILPPPYAGASLLYPPILAGDFNALSIDGDFPEFVPVVQVPDDVMQIGVGKPERFPTQLRVVKVDERIVPDLPPGATCNTPEPAYLVSDHCAAFLRLEPDGPSARDLKGVFIDGPATAAAGSSFTLGAVPSGGGPAYRYRWSPGGFSTPSISLVAGAEGTVIQASVEVTDPVTGRTATNNKSVKATAAAPPPTCRAACATELARCLADPSNPTWPRPTYCGGEYQRCLAQCGP